MHISLYVYIYIYTQIGLAGPASKTKTQQEVWLKQKLTERLQWKDTSPRTSYKTPCAHNSLDLCMYTLCVLLEAWLCWQDLVVLLPSVIGFELSLFQANLAAALPEICPRLPKRGGHAKLNSQHNSKGFLKLLTQPNCIHFVSGNNQLIHSCPINEGFTNQ